MPQERSESPGTPAHRKSTFRPRALTLADGDRLVLDATGSIARIAADGTAKQTWAPDDPDWAGQAIRFGLRERVATANPHGREVRQEPRPR